MERREEGRKGGTEKRRENTKEVIEWEEGEGANLISSTSIVSLWLWEAVKAESIFSLLLWGRLAETRARFYLKDNEKCVSIQTPL